MLKDAGLAFSHARVAPRATEIGLLTIRVLPITKDTRNVWKMGVFARSKTAKVELREVLCRVQLRPQRASSFEQFIASSDADAPRPSALAAFRLMTSLYLIVACTASQPASRFSEGDRHNQRRACNCRLNKDRTSGISSTSGRPQS